MKELIVHTGVHRAGSTAIQNLLVRRHPELLRSNFAVWTRNDLKATGLRRELLTLPSSRVRPLLALPAVLESPADTLVISEENLLGTMPGLHRDTFYPGARRAMATLARFAWACRVSVRVVLRRQDRLLESIYAFRVSRGLSASFEAFAKPLLRERLSWWPLARELAQSTFSEASIALYEDLFHDAAEWDIGAFLGLPRNPSWVTKPMPKANVGLRGPVLHVVRYLNLRSAFTDIAQRLAMLTALAPWSKAGALPSSCELRDALVSAGLANDAGLAGDALAFATAEPLPHFSTRERDRLLERCAQDNQRVLALPHIVSNRSAWT